MGKATIVSGGVDGKYQVRLDYGQAAKTARLAAIDARLAELVGLIAQALQALNLQEYTGAQVEAEVEAAINAYVATTQALAALGPDAEPAVLKALQDAVKNTLKDHTQALAKLAGVVRKTAPLRLAWQILKDEQVQLNKDRVAWAALVLEETVQAWCADLTEDATGAVATVEVPGESKLVLIAPAAPAPDATHGVLAAREVQSPGQVFFNAAILPGWQKYKPTYRRGTVTAIKLELDQVSVTLEAADKSSAQSLGINQAETLVDVPVKYMTCNAAAFEVGDKCIVMFKDQDWATPEVVGFVDNPKSCVTVFSGVTKNGTVVDIGAGKLALDRYKPTQNAWDVPLRKNPAKSPAAFHNEVALAKAGGQYATLRPTLFSGLMAKAVQIVMGRGYVVAYDYRWANCHGISQDAAGKFWLVHMSAAGVRAMLLPLNNGNADSTNEAVKRATLLFGGVPSGAAFPVGAKLTEAMAAGTVKVLLGAAGLTDFYGKTPFASTMGWSFNDTGTEAHNTCHDTDGTNFTSYHYKLALDFSNPASPAASLSLVSQGFLTKKQYTAGGPFNQIPLYIYDYLLGVEVVIPQREVLYTETEVDGTAPLIACHVNGVLEVVSVRVRSEGSYSPTTSWEPETDFTLAWDQIYLPDAFTNDLVAYRPGRSMEFTSMPDTYAAFEVRHSDFTAVSDFYDTQALQRIRGYSFVTTIRQALDANGGGGFFTWGRLSRDAFQQFSVPSTHYLIWGGAGTYFTGSDGAVVSFTGPLQYWPSYPTIDPDFDHLVVGFGQSAAVPKGQTVTTDKPVIFHVGQGAAVTLPDADNTLRDMPYVDVTYSVFGSSVQQVAITQFEYYHALGDLLPGADSDPKSERFTFIGYT